MNFSTLFRLEENLHLDKKTLVILRWIAIFGQLIAVNLVYSYLNLEFPVKKYPEKPKSLNLQKTPEYDGVLVGIKGQYLIFEDENVFNVRSNEGLVVGLDIVH